MSRLSNLTNVLGGCSLIGLVLSIFPIILFLVSLMFEYSFFVLFGKDLPWYIDMMGALVLNGANFIIWVVCLIIDTCGDTPVFPGAFG